MCTDEDIVTDFLTVSIFLGYVLETIYEPVRSERKPHLLNLRMYFFNQINIAYFRVNTFSSHDLC